MRKSRPYEIAVDLIRYYPQVVFGGDICYLFELLTSPDTARRVMRIAEHQKPDFRVCGLLGKILKVYLKSSL